MKIVKIFSLLVLFTGFCLKIHAQAPQISGIDKTSGTVNETVTISGNGFGSVVSNLRVFFGAASAEIISASNLELKVKVPAGATSSSISVTNLNSHLTAFSSEIFTLSYDGNSFNTASLEGGYSFPTGGSDLNNLCVCDFNLDGLNDIATTDLADKKVSVFQNTTPNLNTVSFDALELDLGGETRFVRCSDLNGDGLPDLVFSASNNNSNKERIYTVRNLSTPGGAISFEDRDVLNPIPSYTIDGNIASRIEMRDIDGDGKPEIVAVDFSENGGVSVFRNTSTSGGAIKFAATPITPFTTFGITTTSLSSVAIEDLNGDGKPEVLAGKDESNGIFVFTNASTSGNINFSSYTQVDAPGTTTNIKVGELDGDGKPDIVINTGTHVGFLRNTTTEDGVISFASQVRFDQTSSNREGLDLADMDGNGKLDVIYGSNSATQKIGVLLNNSTVGTFDFATKREVNTAETNISVRASDFNGDGKPDLAYTGIVTDVIYVLLNRNCVTPVLEPVAGLSVCDQLPFELTTTQAIGVNYSWESSLDGNTYAPVVGALDAFAYTASTEAFYQVKVFSSNNTFTCNNTSNVVKVVRPDGFVPDKPTIIDQNPTEPFCAGATVTLKAANVNADFFWEGPNGYTSNEQNPVINNITAAHAGKYTVYVQASAEQGGCQSDTATTYIKVNSPNDIAVTTSDAPVFFEGGQATLAVDDNTTGNTYRWKKDGAFISGATNSTYTATEAGGYAVEVKNLFGCTKTSPAFSTAIAQPNIPVRNCLNEAVSFEVTPTTVNGQNVVYRWDFGDNSTRSQGSSVTHTYSAAATYTAAVEILTNGSPSDRYEQAIEIIDIPALEISTSGSRNLCPGENVTLMVDDTYSAFEWNNGETTHRTTVDEPGTYTVTVTTADNCSITEDIEIVHVPNPEAVIEASIDLISLGDSVRLTASGGASFLWTPGRHLSDSTVANPMARPLLTTTYRVIVTSADGCRDTAEYTLNVKRTLEVNAKKAFTPNNDGVNDTWIIERIELYEDCTVNIFDRQGTKVYQVTPYDNNSGWNGTRNGSQVAAGAYYYLISCGGDAGSATGSVTIVR